MILLHVDKPPQTLDRLERVRLPITQAGNCQFGAVARCIGMQDDGQAARHLAVDHVRSHRERPHGLVSAQVCFWLPEPLVPTTGSNLRRLDGCQSLLPQLGVQT